MNSKLADLFEQLIMLDEIAGELDPDTNARIDSQRATLAKQIKELEVIQDDLQNRGITVWDWYQANNCIGVTYGRVSCYYYVRDGKVFDVVFD